MGKWQDAVAILTAEMAKESAIGTLAVLNGISEEAEDAAVMAGIAGMLTPMAAFSFMVLNLFDPPCLVAMVTIAREMGDKKWAAAALLFQLAVGYSLALVAYNLGNWLFFGAPFGVGQGAAILLCLTAAYFILRPAPKNGGKKTEKQPV